MTETGAIDLNAVEVRCINTIRTLSIDAIQKANSGHPGAPMGLAAAAFVLWTRIMKHNPRNPDWLNRDRFVLSGGHASMLLYSLLHLCGYDLSIEDLKNFRQWGSKTPGHPEFGHTPGVETTTGPLGQGLANAVGLAMAERHLAARYNGSETAIVDHFTYCFCGDGDLMEGISAEAASMAGHLKLGRLICLYDSNDISIEGDTDIAFTEDVSARFAAMNWQVLRVENGNDTAAIANAFRQGQVQSDQPTLIVLRTQIAYGSPNKQGSAGAHGAPLGEKEVCLTKECLGCPPEENFCVPEDVRAEFDQCIQRGAAAEAQWQQLFDHQKTEEPKRTGEYLDAISGLLVDGWDAAIPEFKTDDPALSTRVASGQVLNGLAQKVPTLMGGSADLAPSNMTFIKDEPEFQAHQYAGRNIRFGVREFGMTAVMSGLCLHGGIRPYGGTFLVFADYMRPAIRVAALMKLPVIYVLTHDSIAVGEDGPTHQPVEHIASLRAMPGVTVIRPADATETAQAWRLALAGSKGPIALALSRQNLPILDAAVTTNGLNSGGYILSDGTDTPKAILIASGSEVSLALQAQQQLADQNISVRVVSMPSWELFESMDVSYREHVLPSAVTARLAIEAGSPMGWERYVGANGAILGIDTFGASAPGGTVMAQYGFTVENVVAKTMALLDQ